MDKGVTPEVAEVDKGRKGGFRELDKGVPRKAAGGGQGGDARNMSRVPRTCFACQR
ncbi:hypothetical protein ALMP_11880 [Streptomyces sp. A012304]|nr:hypothetical protein ALMP_11880 [Streptomyces sp. A012304]